MFVQAINKSFIRPHKMCISRFKAVNQNILSRAEPVRHGHKIRPVRRFLDGHPPFQRRQIHDLIPELLVFCDRQIQLGQYAAEIKAVAADTNSDGTVDAADMSVLKQYFVGAESALGAVSPGYEISYVMRDNDISDNWNY